MLLEINTHHLEDTFNDIVTDVDNKLESVQNIIQKNNLVLGDTYFIGDSNHEIEASKELGITSIGVTWGFLSKKKLKICNPDFLIDNVGGLEKIIL